MTPEYYQKHREKIRADQKAYWQKNRDSIRYKRVLKKYGLTELQVQQKLKDQDGKCAICQLPLQKPQIDHNHQTGKVRSLLCVQCNTMIGLAQESVSVLRAAVRYLEAHSG